MIQTFSILEIIFFLCAVLVEVSITMLVMIILYKIAVDMIDKKGDKL